MTKEGLKQTGYSEEGMNWCKKHNHEIDYELVRILKPNCIEENNGCGNCQFCGYKVVVA